jgi:hypothetical protein
MLMVVSDPAPKYPDQHEGAGPLPQPETFLLKGTHDLLCIRVALQVVITGARLVNAQGRTRLHEGQRRGLAPVVTHQAQALTARPLGTLPGDRHV